jgi:hypothetical protein
MLTLIFATLMIVFLIFDIFQIAEIHSKNKLLNECADRLNESRILETKLVVKNTYLLNTITSLRWVLTSIRDCNNGDPVFEIWAKQLATDSLERSKKAYDN